MTTNKKEITTKIDSMNVLEDLKQVKAVGSDGLYRFGIMNPIIDKAQLYQYDSGYIVTDKKIADMQPVEGSIAHRTLKMEETDTMACFQLDPNIFFIRPADEKESRIGQRPQRLATGFVSRSKELFVSDRMWLEWTGYTKAAMPQDVRFALHVHFSKKLKYIELKKVSPMGRPCKYECIKPNANKYVFGGKAIDKWFWVKPHGERFTLPRFVVEAFQLSDEIELNCRLNGNVLRFEAPKTVCACCGKRIQFDGHLCTGKVSKEFSTTLPEIRTLVKNTMASKNKDRFNAAIQYLDEQIHGLKEELHSLDAAAVWFATERRAPTDREGM